MQHCAYAHLVNVPACLHGMDPAPPTSSCTRPQSTHTQAHHSTILELCLQPIRTLFWCH
jgi:hypothetical protein